MTSGATRTVAYAGKDNAFDVSLDGEGGREVGREGGREGGVTDCYTYSNSNIIQCHHSI